MKQTTFAAPAIAEPKTIPQTIPTEKPKTSPYEPGPGINPKPKA